MTMPLRGSRPLAFAVLAAACLAALPARAETLDSTTVDSRLILAFDAPDAAVAGAVPEAFAAAPFGGGPLAGADFLLVFIDGHSYRDAEGNPLHGGRFRAVSGVVPATAAGSDETVYVVTHLYINDAAIDPYRNAVGAGITRQELATGTGGAAASARESWSVAPETGGEIAMSMAYERGTPGRSEREIRVHSNVEPDFFRIYRYTQYAELLMSVPGQVDRVESLALDVSVPELAAIFDGTEELVGVLAQPWYDREIWLP